MKVVSCFLVFLLITFFSAANNFNVFEENGLVGLKDGQGRVLIPAQYEALGWSNGQFSVVSNVTGYKFKGHWGLINVNNHKVTKTEFEELLPGEGPLLIARKKSNLSLRIVTGCINTSGKEIIPFQYDGITLLTLRAIVFTKIGNQYRYGLIDLENKTLIPQQYRSVYSIGSLRFAVENFEKKIALFSDNGKQISEFTIDSISSFKKNFAVIYQNARQGVIDREGQVQVESKYRAVNISDEGVISVREDDTWQFLDGQNKLIQKASADRIEPVGKNLLKVTTATQVRLTDQQLKPISPSWFSSIHEFKNNEAIFIQNDKLGIVSTSGAIIIPAEFDSLYTMRNLRVAMQYHSGKKVWMLLDSLGHHLTSKPYESLEPLNGKYFTVRQRGFAGALNLRGQEVVACSYDSILQTRDDLIVVKFRGQYGIINVNEEWKVTPRNQKLVLIGADRFLETSGTKTFLKSIDGNIIYFTDNHLEIFADYFWEHLPSGTIWKIDRDGRIIDRQVHPDEPIQGIYEESEGLRAILKNGQYGFIDSQGRLRIANRYEGVQKFSEGLAAAKIRGKWGFINHQDQIAIQPAYDEVSLFQNGFAYVRQRGLFGIIDKNGKQVLPARYEAVKLLPTGNLLITLNQQEGLADASGKILIQPRYHRLQDVGNNFAIVERDGKYGVVTHQSISTIPLLYDFISYDPYHAQFLALTQSLWTTISR
ncbi:MAG TPA: WG repeat-containing protein [Ohtaekwangia sp.]